MKSLTLILLVFFLLVLPISFASFNCQLTNNIKECNNIINSNINEYQKDQLFSSLLYNSSNYPNHNIIFNYNKNIKVDSSITNVTNSKYIKNAYLVLLTIMPSVIEDNILYTTDSTYVLSEYNYTIYLPKDNSKCPSKYTIIENKANFNVLVNNEIIGNNKLQLIKIDKDSIIKDTLSINIIIKQDNYKLINNKCKYSSTNYLKDQVNLEDSINVKYYAIKEPNIDINIIDNYLNTIKFNFTVSNYTGFTISFNNSFIKEEKYRYYVYFIKKPYYIAVLKADKVNIKKSNIISGDNNSLYVNSVFAQDFPKSLNCKVIVNDFFNNYSYDCNLTLNKEVNEKYEVKRFNFDLFYFLKIIILVFIIYLIYRILRYFIGKWIEF